MTQESIRSLDEIMSREPATEPVQEPIIPATPETEEQGQTRDETGKFAPKPQSGDGVDGASDKAAQAAVEGGDGKGKVPLQAVQAERGKRKEAENEAEALRRELAELRGQVSVLSRPQAQPQPPAVEKPKKTFWEDPDGFLAERLAPVQQSMDEQRIELSTMLAVKDHGQDIVNEARAALVEAMQANPQDPSIIALDQTTRKSVHPMNDVVTWHQRRKAMADIGDDPEAFRTRERERLRQEILAEMGQPAAPATPATPAAKTPMPSNFAGARSEGPRSSVTYSGPKPLSEITKGSAQ